MVEESAHAAAPTDSATASGRPETSAAMFADQVQLVHHNAPVALGGILLNALVLAYVLWPNEPRAPLLLWLAALCAVIGVRALQAWAFPRTTDKRALRQWLRGYRATTLVSGIVWGAVGLVVPTASLADQVFIAFLSGGLAAGATSSYASVAWLPHLFVVPAAGLVALGLVLHGGRNALVMAGMVVVFGALVSIIGRSAHDTLLSALRLRTENRELVAYLTEAKSRTERLNDELKAEITERGLAEQALRESEERFRSLVESATDGIGFTYEGLIYYANQAALDLIGYEADEVLGLPIESFLATTTLPADDIHQVYLDRIAGKAVPRQYETRMVRKDGTVVDVMFSNSLVSLDGRPGVMSIVKDITERKKAEEELRIAKETAEEATRLKDQFVSLVAHDLRAPLNSILSLLAVLRSDTAHPLPSEQQEILHVVGDQGDATLRMIDDLLQMSRLHTGKLQPEPHFVDATAVTATAMALLKPLAVEKQVQLSEEVPPRTRLYTDADMFSKVLYNLLANAIKFAPRGGHIRIFVPPGRHGTVAVQDDGAGVDPELLPNLFRHEVKTTKPGTAGEIGTGLGLPLCQDLMHALGGEITVETTAGKGSVFYATLPAVRPKVLVVGVDESLSLFVHPHLEHIDADFVEAADGDDALTKLGEGVHLVIIEADLREDGGLQLLQRIRATPEGRHLPLIVIANRAESGLAEQGFRLGADEIIIKPLVPEDFLMRLRRFIT